MRAATSAGPPGAAVAGSVADGRTAHAAATTIPPTHHAERRMKRGRRTMRPMPRQLDIRFSLQRRRTPRVSPRILIVEWLLLYRGVRGGCGLLVSGWYQDLRRRRRLPDRP